MKKIEINIFAFPLVACDYSKSWLAAVDLLRKRLVQRYGERIEVKFVEIFSPESFKYEMIMGKIRDETLPDPIVSLNGTIIQSGGKLSESKIRNFIDNYNT